LVGDDDARIDWSRPAVELDRLARGCDPQPGAWAEREGERVRLFDVQLAPGPEGGEPPGRVLGLEAGQLLIAAESGRLSVGRLRVGSGAKLAAAEAGLSPGDRLV
jgi:methionyl-tRNA formyltransferase